MLHLMNSAVMLQDGAYTKKTISSAGVKALFWTYQNSNSYKSYIGYPNACRVLGLLLDTQIELCRDETLLKSGDEILAMRLRYRVNPAEKKGRQHGNLLEDYEFSRISFAAQA